MSFVNVTVLLSNSTSAQVTQTYYIELTNASIKQYNQYRIALNFSIEEWEKALGITITQYIYNPHSSTSNFTFFPSAVMPTFYGGLATITLTYIAKNITTVKEIGPRKFEYTFNDSSFNFPLTGSGEALPKNTRLNIEIPKYAYVVNIYPTPDYPFTSIISYKNDTFFSWYTSEPLANFKFVYIVNQSLFNEIVSFFTYYIHSIYFFYTIIVILILIILIYIYRSLL